MLNKPPKKKRPHNKLLALTAVSFQSICWLNKQTNSIMTKFIVWFHLLLLLILIPAYFVHQHYYFADNLITLYLFNGLIAVFVVGSAFLFRKKHKDYIAFYFFGGTIIKSLLFFVLIFPLYKQDNDISRTEFLSFFVPYLLTLLVETISLVRLLNKANDKSFKNTEKYSKNSI